MSTAPEPLDAPPLTDAAWTALFRGAFCARLDAALEAAFARDARRLLGGASVILAFVTTLGGLAAIATLLREQGDTLARIVTLLVSIAAVLQTVLRLPDRIAKAIAVEEAWAERQAFWTDVVIGMQAGQYFGSLSTLADGDARARRMTAELGFPAMMFWRKMLMDRIENSESVFVQSAAPMDAR